MKNVLILDSGGYNLASIKFALERLDVSSKISNNKNEIKNADRIIIPGVGTAHNAMNILSKNDLSEALLNFKRPILGICIGMQILFETSCEVATNNINSNSNESEDIQCLGILKGNIKKLSSTDSNFPCPHMGWNSLEILSDNILFKNISRNENENRVYFVHSYYTSDSDYSIANTYYPHKICVAINKDNLWGCQFHPEKSGSIGNEILKNFLEI